MTSRITRTTFTVVSFAGLVVLGLFLCNLNAGRANAQRIDTPLNEPIKSRFTVNSPPVFRAENQSNATESTALAPFSDPAPSWEKLPYSTTSAVLVQPIVVAVKEGPQLRGEPVALGALQVKTIFGPVSIPVDRIAGVRTADDPRQPATICLSNGDSLTGVLATDSITIKTQWGSATIARDHIVSIVTTTESVAWQQHEGRWRIAPAKPATPDAASEETGEQAGEIDTRAQATQPVSPAPFVPAPSESDPTNDAKPSLN